MLSSAYKSSLNRLVNALTLTPTVGDYLAGRGIPAELARKFRLGGVPGDLPEWQQYEGMLCVPYMTPSGPVAVKFRAVGSRTYLNPLGQNARLYNVGDLHKTGNKIAVCEGELDTVIMSGVAGVPAVGVAGVNNWEPHFARVLEGYDDVVVVGDNDVKDPERNHGREFANRLVKAMPQARMVLPPAGLDVNELFLTQGADAVRALVIVDD